MSVRATDEELANVLRLTGTACRLDAINSARVVEIARKIAAEVVALRAEMVSWREATGAETPDEYEEKRARLPIRRKLLVGDRVRTSKTIKVTGWFTGTWADRRRPNSSGTVLREVDVTCSDVDAFAVDHGDGEETPYFADELHPEVSRCPEAEGESMGDVSETETKLRAEIVEWKLATGSDSPSEYEVNQRSLAREQSEREP